MPMENSPPGIHTMPRGADGGGVSASLDSVAAWGAGEMRAGAMTTWWRGTGSGARLHAESKIISKPPRNGPVTVRRLAGDMPNTIGAESARVHLRLRLVQVGPRKTVSCDAEMSGGAERAWD